jgi:hypothetical protein
VQNDNKNAEVNNGTRLNEYNGGVQVFGAQVCGTYSHDSLASQEYLPAGQVLHVGEPHPAYFPPGQGVQVSLAGPLNGV